MLRSAMRVIIIGLCLLVASCKTSSTDSSEKGRGVIGIPEPGDVNSNKVADEKTAEIFIPTILSQVTEVLQQFDHFDLRDGQGPVDVRVTKIVIAPVGSATTQITFDVAGGLDGQGAFAEEALPASNPAVVSGEFKQPSAGLSAAAAMEWTYKQMQYNIWVHLNYKSPDKSGDFLHVLNGGTLTVVPELHFLFNVGFNFSLTGLIPNDLIKSAIVKLLAKDFTLNANVKSTFDRESYVPLETLPNIIKNQENTGNEVLLSDFQFIIAENFKEFCKNRLLATLSDITEEEKPTFCDYSNTRYTRYEDALAALGPSPDAQTPANQETEFVVRSCSREAYSSIYTFNVDGMPPAQTKLWLYVHTKGDNFYKRVDINDGGWPSKNVEFISQGFSLGSSKVTAEIPSSTINFAEICANKLPAQTCLNGSGSNYVFVSSDRGQRFAPKDENFCQ